MSHWVQINLLITALGGGGGGFKCVCVCVCVCVCWGLKGYEEGGGTEQPPHHLLCCFEDFMSKKIEFIIRMCGITHLYMRHDSFINVIRTTHKCDVMHYECITPMGVT